MSSHVPQAGAVLNLRCIKEDMEAQGPWKQETGITPRSLAAGYKLLTQSSCVSNVACPSADRGCGEKDRLQQHLKGGRLRMWLCGSVALWPCGSVAPGLDLGFCGIRDLVYFCGDIFSLSPLEPIFTAERN